jgi:sporulation protein YlmC with PRC-barrel domain
MHTKLSVLGLLLLLIPGVAFGAPAAPVSPPGQTGMQASHLLGAAVTTKSAAPLGTITDLLCDGVQHRVAYIVVSKQGTLAAVPWVALSPAAKPGEFRAAADASDAAIPVDQALNLNPTLLDLTVGLFNRPLVAADGARAGVVSDAVIDLHSGQIGKLLASTPDSSPALKVLSWGSIAGLFLQRAIVLNISAQQVAQLPSYDASARVASSSEQAD